MKAKYKAGIVGCGNIGGFLDSPKDKMIVTHAHAYSTIKDFKLTCCCDLNPKSISSFKSRWGREIRGYLNFEELLKNESIDVISICSNTAGHAGLLMEAFEKDGLKVMICEKPLVETLSEIELVNKIIKQHPEKSLVVNYSMRYDPSFKIVEGILQKNELGRPLRFSATFTKGLYHNGCHMFELLARLFGKPRDLTALEVSILDKDYYGSFFLNYEFCSGSMFSLKGCNYFNFELDIFLENGKIQITDSGRTINIFKRKRSCYRGYYELELDRKLADTLKFSTFNLMRYVCKLLELDSSHDSMLKFHLKVSEDLLCIKEGLSSGKEKIVIP